MDFPIGVRPALWINLDAGIDTLTYVKIQHRFSPGTYEGSASGFGGEVKVRVTVDDDCITSIEISGPDETPALGGTAIPIMAEAYIGKADANAVDGMTGATVTSTAVKEAVMEALSFAKRQN